MFRGPPVEEETGSGKHVAHLKDSWVEVGFRLGCSGSGSWTQQCAP